MCIVAFALTLVGKFNFEKFWQNFQEPWTFPSVPSSPWFRSGWCSPEYSSLFRPVFEWSDTFLTLRPEDSVVRTRRKDSRPLSVLPPLSYSSSSSTSSGSFWVWSIWMLVKKQVTGCVWVYGSRFYVHFRDQLFEEHYCDSGLYYTAFAAVTAYLVSSRKHKGHPKSISTVTQSSLSLTCHKFALILTVLTRNSQNFRVTSRNSVCE